MRKMLFSGIGISALLVIFAVLCLCVFALLSITTVQAQQRLGDNAAQAVTDYYAADCKAQEILAQLRGGDIPDCVTLENGCYSYRCPISETQTLSVTVRIDGDHFEILRWQTVSTIEWQPEDSLPVWDGDQ